MTKVKVQRAVPAGACCRSTGTVSNRNRRPRNAVMLLVRRPARPKRATLAGPNAAAWGLGCGRSGVYVPLRPNRQPVSARIRAGGASETQAWRPSMHFNPRMGRSASSAGLGLCWCASRGTTGLPWAVTHRPPSPLCRRVRAAPGAAPATLAGRGLTESSSPSASQQAMKTVCRPAKQSSNGDGSSPAKKLTKCETGGQGHSKRSAQKRTAWICNTEQTGHQLSLMKPCCTLQPALT